MYNTFNIRKFNKSRGLYIYTIPKRGDGSGGGNICDAWRKKTTSNSKEYVLNKPPGESLMPFALLHEATTAHSGNTSAGSKEAY